eukprot:m.32921 g.32921  ORF g.32921 m.32921 type:complete len:3451 (-) comp9563_c0_seq1:176-10528(-)
MKMAAMEQDTPWTLERILDAEDEELESVFQQTTNYAFSTVREAMFEHGKEFLKAMDVGDESTQEWWLLRFATAVHAVFLVNKRWQSHTKTWCKQLHNPKAIDQLCKSKKFRQFVEFVQTELIGIGLLNNADYLIESLESTGSRSARLVWLKHILQQHEEVDESIEELCLAIDALGSANSNVLSEYKAAASEASAVNDPMNLGSLPTIVKLARVSGLEPFPPLSKLDFIKWAKRFCRESKKQGDVHPLPLSTEYANTTNFPEDNYEEWVKAVPLVELFGQEVEWRDCSLNEKRQAWMQRVAEERGQHRLQTERAKQTKDPFYCLKVMEQRQEIGQRKQVILPVISFLENHAEHSPFMGVEEPVPVNLLIDPAQPTGKVTVELQRMSVNLNISFALFERKQVSQPTKPVDWLDPDEKRTILVSFASNAASTCFRAMKAGGWEQLSKQKRGLNLNEMLNLLTSQCPQFESIDFTLPRDSALLRLAIKSRQVAFLRDQLYVVLPTLWHTVSTEGTTIQPLAFRVTVPFAHLKGTPLMHTLDCLFERCQQHPLPSTTPLSALCKLLAAPERNPVVTRLLSNAAMNLGATDKYNPLHDAPRPASAPPSIVAQEAVKCLQVLLQGHATSDVAADEDDEAGRLEKQHVRALTRSQCIVHESHIPHLQRLLETQGMHIDIQRVNQFNFSGCLKRIDAFGRSRSAFWTGLRVLVVLPTGPLSPVQFSKLVETLFEMPQVACCICYKPWLASILADLPRVLNQLWICGSVQSLLSKQELTRFTPESDSPQLSTFFNITSKICAKQPERLMVKQPRAIGIEEEELKSSEQVVLDFLAKHHSRRLNSKDSERDLLIVNAGTMPTEQDLEYLATSFSLVSWSIQDRVRTDVKPCIILRDCHLVSWERIIKVLLSCLEMCGAVVLHDPSGDPRVRFDLEQALPNFKLSVSHFSMPGNPLATRLLTIKDSHEAKLQLLLGTVQLSTILNKGVEAQTEVDIEDTHTKWLAGVVIDFVARDMADLLVDDRALEVMQQFNKAQCEHYGLTHLAVVTCYLCIEFMNQLGDQDLNRFATHSAMHYLVASVCRASRDCGAVSTFPEFLNSWPWAQFCSQYVRVGYYLKHIDQRQDLSPQNFVRLAANGFEADQLFATCNVTSSCLLHMFTRRHDASHDGEPCFALQEHQLGQGERADLQTAVELFRGHQINWNTACILWQSFPYGAQSLKYILESCSEKLLVLLLLSERSLKRVFHGLTNKFLSEQARQALALQMNQFQAVLGSGGGGGDAQQDAVACLPAWVARRFAFLKLQCLCTNVCDSDGLRFSRSELRLIDRLVEGMDLSNAANSLRQALLALDVGSTLDLPNEFRQLIQQPDMSVLEGELQLGSAWMFDVVLNHREPRKPWCGVRELQVLRKLFKNRSGGSRQPAHDQEEEGEEEPESAADDALAELDELDGDQSDFAALEFEVKLTADAFQVLMRKVLEDPAICKDAPQMLQELYKDDMELLKRHTQHMFDELLCRGKELQLSYPLFYSLVRPVLNQFMPRDVEAFKDANDIGKWLVDCLNHQNALPLPTATTELTLTHETQTCAVHAALQCVDDLDDTLDAVLDRAKTMLKAFVSENNVNDVVKLVEKTDGLVLSPRQLRCFQVFAVSVWHQYPFVRVEPPYLHDEEREGWTDDLNQLLFKRLQYRHVDTFAKTPSMFYTALCAPERCLAVHCSQVFSKLNKHNALTFKVEEVFDDLESGEQGHVGVFTRTLPKAMMALPDNLKIKENAFQKVKATVVDRRHELCDDVVSTSQFQLWKPSLALACEFSPQAAAWNASALIHSAALYEFITAVLDDGMDDVDERLLSQVLDLVRVTMHLVRLWVMSIGTTVSDLLVRALKSEDKATHDAVHDAVHDIFQSVTSQKKVNRIHYPVFVSRATDLMLVDKSYFELMSDIPRWPLIVAFDGAVPLMLDVIEHSQQAAKYFGRSTDDQRFTLERLFSFTTVDINRFPPESVTVANAKPLLKDSFEETLKTLSDLERRGEKEKHFYSLFGWLSVVEAAIRDLFVPKDSDGAIEEFLYKHLNDIDVDGTKLKSLTGFRAVVGALGATWGCVVQRWRLKNVHAASVSLMKNLSSIRGEDVTLPKEQGDGHASSQEDQKRAVEKKARQFVSASTCTWSEAGFESEPLKLSSAGSTLVAPRFLPDGALISAPSLFNTVFNETKANSQGKKNWHATLELCHGGSCMLVHWHAQLQRSKEKEPCTWVPPGIDFFEFVSLYDMPPHFAERLSRESDIIGTFDTYAEAWTFLHHRTGPSTCILTDSVILRRPSKALTWKAQWLDTSHLGDTAMGRAFVALSKSSRHFAAGLEPRVCKALPACLDSRSFDWLLSSGSLPLNSSQALALALPWTELLTQMSCRINVEEQHRDAGALQYLLSNLVPSSRAAYFLQRLVSPEELWMEVDDPSGDDNASDDDDTDSLSAKAGDTVCALSVDGQQELAVHFQFLPEKRQHASSARVCLAVMFPTTFEAASRPEFCQWLVDVLLAPLQQKTIEMILACIQDQDIALSPADTDHTIATALAYCCPDDSVKDALANLTDTLRGNLDREHLRFFLTRKSKRYGVIVCGDEYEFLHAQLGVSLRLYKVDRGDYDYSRIYLDIIGTFDDACTMVYVRGLHAASDTFLKWICEYTEQFPWRFVYFENLDVRYHFPEIRDRLSVSPKTHAVQEIKVWDREYPYAGQAMQDEVTQEPYQPEWQEAIEELTSKSKQFVLLVTSPPGVGKTHFLSSHVKFLKQSSKGVNWNFHRFDCSDDALVSLGVSEKLDQDFPVSDNSLLVADEFHLLNTPQKMELFAWFLPKLSWLRVILVGNRYLAADNDLLNRVRSQMKAASSIAIEHFDVELSVPEVSEVLVEKDGESDPPSINTDKTNIVIAWFKLVQVLFGKHAMSYRVAFQVRDNIQQSHEPEDIARVFGDALHYKLPYLPKQFCFELAETFSIEYSHAKDREYCETALQQSAGRFAATLLLTALSLAEPSKVVPLAKFCTSGTAPSFPPEERVHAWIIKCMEWSPEDDKSVKLRDWLGQEKWVDNDPIPFINDALGASVAMSSGKATRPCIGVDGNYLDLEWVRNSSAHDRPIDWSEAKKEWKQFPLTNRGAFLSLLHDCKNRQMCLMSVDFHNLKTLAGDISVDPNDPDTLGETICESFKLLSYPDQLDLEQLRPEHEVHLFGLWRKLLRLLVLAKLDKEIPEITELLTTRCGQLCVVWAAKNIDHIAFRGSKPSELDMNAKLLDVAQRVTVQAVATIKGSELLKRVITTLWHGQLFEAALESCKKATFSSLMLAWASDEASPYWPDCQHGVWQVFPHPKHEGSAKMKLPMARAAQFLDEGTRAFVTTVVDHATLTDVNPHIRELANNLVTFLCKQKENEWHAVKWSATPLLKYLDAPEDDSEEMNVIQTNFIDEAKRATTFPKTPAQIEQVLKGLPGYFKQRF